MASLPRCSLSLATATPAPRALIYLQRALSSGQNSRSTPNPPILDFLLPSSIANPAPRPAKFLRRSQTTTVASSAAARGTGSAIYSHVCQKTPLVKAWCSSPLPASQSTSLQTKARPALQQPRCFSTTARRSATRTLLNPQVDEDGNEMCLEITARAAKRLAKVMEKDGNPRLALRIQVESGGCHGFQYVMGLVTLPDQLPSDTNAAASTDADADNGAKPSIISEDDTIFTYAGEAEEGDTAAETGDPLSAPKIILDTPSLELLKGSKVDFTMELIGSQFKIVDNPLATSSCGCGTSFDIKI